MGRHKFLYNDYDRSRSPGKTLWECEHCRFPLTMNPPFLFCNEVQAEGSSYCEAHKKRCNAKYTLPIDVDALVKL